MILFVACSALLWRGIDKASRYSTKQYLLSGSVHIKEVMEKISAPVILKDYTTVLTPQEASVLLHAKQFTDRLDSSFKYFGYTIQVLITLLFSLAISSLKTKGITR
jgi:hypothetical protein